MKSSILCGLHLQCTVSVYVVCEYLEYWNHYRPHAGLDGNLVLPYPQDMNAPVKKISFLGGLLHGYRQKSLAA